jgi:hypothetical protein
LSHSASLELNLSKWKVGVYLSPAILVLVITHTKISMKSKDHSSNGINYW